MGDLEATRREVWIALFDVEKAMEYIDQQLLEALANLGKLSAKVLENKHEDEYREHILNLMYDLCWIYGKSHSTKQNIKYYQKRLERIEDNKEKKKEEE